MTFRFGTFIAFLLVAHHGSAISQAQEILFTDNAAYLDNSTTPPTPRVSLHGYLNSVVQNGSTYQYVGVVLSNSYSTYNDIANPAANAPGTTFAYGANSPFGPLASSKSWLADMRLPVKTISTDPSNPTYITASFYLVSNTGAPYNQAVFSTYCFATYISAGKVLTSPAGGPYFVVLPPGLTGMNGKGSKEIGTADAKGQIRMLPAPKGLDRTLDGFWENGSSVHSDVLRLEVALQPADRRRLNLANMQELGDILA